MSRVLVWQWGRRGAGPRFALNLAEAIDSLPGLDVVLSLSARAEILAGDKKVPVRMLPMETYGSLPGLLMRLLQAPVLVPHIMRAVRARRPDFAICAMTGPLDLLMAVALRCSGVPYAVVVHDAVMHPGDGFPLQFMLQRLLLWRADVMVVLSRHVAAQLRQQRVLRGREIVMSSHPPFDYFSGGAGAVVLSAGRVAGPVRFLMFGRLLTYKGLDLLAAALAMMPAGLAFECRIVGHGPESAALRALAGLPHVRVENRWVPESEIPALIAWADVMLLPYREASQSGVGAIALSAGRWVVSTNVGGLREQFQDRSRALLCEPTAVAFCARLVELAERQPLLPEVPADPGEGGWSAVAARMVADIEKALVGRAAMAI
ncbi:glycosyltransferase [Acetobacter oeni]|uniref:Glycosyltransferase subfamily 4-like N-terminal domain-containing protein n=1 Tax=Acetobacter oeni TaxID=304077 RepID=A0A511XH24_9PROT|nr:glycosyltransferase [Acetobacter oeni]MBB3882394.1 glycosyltransferase involved in cell wall biosynthesis [Acetobacter oeni]NHO18507.1 glycosyltransferase [Acetobacter oeni]GBR09387.1 lipopolysaccharide core biosynthesis mannosyltransferase [Acetobacter oeni LMG 21952]GEN62252.1 hypothetical protein AOE01nite_04760 [Acetobacter oeni]